MNIIERLLAPTPYFFKVLRDLGLILAAASGAILAAPVTFPTMLVSIAGYLAVGASVLSAVSQTAVDDSVLSPPATDPPEPESPPPPAVKRKGREKQVNSTD